MPTNECLRSYVSNGCLPYQIKYVGVNTHTHNIPHACAFIFITNVAPHAALPNCFLNARSKRLTSNVKIQA